MEDTHLQRFDEIAKEICELHREKDADYGNSFGETYKKLGIISAVTRISDKYNRLANLAKNMGETHVEESLEDTLRDMAAYAIMTIVELERDEMEIAEGIKKIMGESENSKPSSHSNGIIDGRYYRCKGAYGELMFEKGQIYPAKNGCLIAGGSALRIGQKTLERFFELVD